MILREGVGLCPTLSSYEPVLTREGRGKIMAQKNKPLVRQVVEEVGKELDYEVVDVFFAREDRKRVLRVFIDRPGGINIKDCEVFSGRLSTVLDEKDPIPGPYFLEVSSPGINRPLTKPEHFQRFSGEPVELKLYSSFQGRKRIKGRLEGWSPEGDGAVLLEVDGEKMSVPWSMVTKARLDLED